MGNLWNSDSARDLRGINGRACVLQDELHVKDGDDLALSLRHVNVSVTTDNLANLGLGLAVGSLNLGQVFIEPLLCPGGHVLVDPVPVVGIVEDHLV